MLYITGIKLYKNSKNLKNIGITLYLYVYNSEEKKYN